MKCDRGFAGTSCKRQQYAVVTFTNRLQHGVNRVVLVVTRAPLTATIFKRDRCKLTAPKRFPAAGLAIDVLPHLLRADIGIHFALDTGFHIDLVDADAIGRVGVAGLQVSGVAFGLIQPLGQRLFIGLGLDHSQLVVTVSQYVIRYAFLRSAPVADQATGRDDLAIDTTAIHIAPACLTQGRVDQFCTGIGFVHTPTSLSTLSGLLVSSPAKAFFRMDCLSRPRLANFSFPFSFSSLAELLTFSNSSTI